MGILQAVVDSFIVAMGITPPKPEKKRMATICIAAGLLVLGLGLVVLFLFVIAVSFPHA